MKSENIIETKHVDADRIKAAFYENHLTNAEMAGKLQISYGTLRNKMVGQTNWTLSDLLIISAVTGHPVDYFLS